MYRENKYRLYAYVYKVADKRVFYNNNKNINFIGHYLPSGYEALVHVWLSSCHKIFKKTHKTPLQNMYKYN